MTLACVIDFAGFLTSVDDLDEAARLLENVVGLAGGYRAWLQASLPVEK
jgi:hypothetical protein